MELRKMSIIKPLFFQGFYGGKSPDNFWGNEVTVDLLYKSVYGKTSLTGSLAEFRRLHATESDQNLSFPGT